MAKTSSGAGLGCVWRGWGLAYGEPLVAKSPELGSIPTQPPSKGGALAALVVSANYVHLRVWEVSWGRPLVCTADALMGPTVPLIHSIIHSSKAVAHLPIWASPPG